MNALDTNGKFKSSDFIRDSATEILQYDAAAVQRPRGEAARSYSVRARIYPKLAHGNFRRVKWLVMLVTLGIYYFLPWVRWDRGEGLPHQFFLIDFAHQRLLLGPVEIWAQEFYYITGLLIISALGLFLVTALAGRVWCGYACPQTVWTDLMIMVERFWQGDRNAHMRLDQQQWTFEKIWKKTATHLTWILIGLFTGGALIFYFRDAPTLMDELLHGTASPVAVVFLGIFTFSTYLLGGIAREQVCIYMCPWPRIQGAMLDRDSLLISYRDLRGEPRGAHKKGQSWEGRGDCVDCRACVVVCPMGIDIRNGSQLECIQCALCIDACNEIMDKVGRPRGLIAYSTERNQMSKTAGPRDGLTFLRPRILIYSFLILLVGTVMLWAMLSRSDMAVSVLPDRNPLFVRLSDGGIRNGYTIKVSNKKQKVRRFKIDLSGLENVNISIVGLEKEQFIFEIPPADVRALKVFVSLPSEAVKKLRTDSTSLRFTVQEVGGGAVSTRDTSFRSPHP